MNYLSELKSKKLSSCPHCNSIEICKYGHFRDRQRYMCKKCHKTFTSYTSTPLNYSKIDIDVWYKYLDCMNKKLTLKQCSELLDIDIKTSFRMRHKILSAIISDEALLKGEVNIIRRTYIENRKGRKNLTDNKKKYNLHFGMDSSNNKFIDLSEGPMSVKLVQDVLDKKVDKDAFIIRSVNTFINKAAPKLKDDKSVMKNIIACNEYTRYKNWHKCFRGIATIYIYRYYYWYNNAINIKNKFILSF